MRAFSEYLFVFLCVSLAVILLNGCTTEAAVRPMSSEKPFVLKEDPKAFEGLLWVPVGKTYALTKKNHDIVWAKADKACEPNVMIPTFDEFRDLGSRLELMKRKLLRLEFICR